MNSTATCYTRRKSFIPFFKDWWQIVSLISSCIVRTLSFFSDILRVPTAVCVSGSIHQTVHGDCINIQRRVSQHQRDSERDCLSLTHFSLGNVGLSWHMSGNVLLLTLSTFIYAWILLPLSLSITRTQAGSKWGGKEAGKEIKLRAVRRWGGESTSETWHTKEGSQRLSCLFMSLENINSALFYGRHRIVPLNRQRNPDQEQRVGRETQTSTEPAELLQTGAEVSSAPELQQTAAGKPSASARRETLACITSIYF